MFSPAPEGIVVQVLFSMRSPYPHWLVPATNWMYAVGHQLSGLQVTKGGPIRKGMSGRVRLDRNELKGWIARMMPLRYRFVFFATSARILV